MFEQDVFIGNLKSLRKQKGLSAAEFAEALGMSRSTISRWDSGERFPSIDVLWRIADFFDISLDELVGRER